MEKSAKRERKRGLKEGRTFRRAFLFSIFQWWFTGALPAAACSCVSSCAWMGLGDASVKCLLVLLQGMETRQCIQWDCGCLDTLGAGLSGQLTEHWSSMFQVSKRSSESMYIKMKPTKHYIDAFVEMISVLKLYSFNA